MKISQVIAIKSKDNSYRFSVYKGQEWLNKIMEAKKGNSQQEVNNGDYIEEVQRLKKLLDGGIIT